MRKKPPQLIGQINQRVIDLTGVTLLKDTPIYLGESNIQHMMSEHPDDFVKYGDKIAEIIANPDYIAKHPSKDSIEYIKVFHDHVSNEHVLVAVRASSNGVYYARSLFVMTNAKKQKYQSKGAFLKY